MLSLARLTTLLPTFAIFCVLSGSHPAQAQVDTTQTSSSEHIASRVIEKARGNATYPIGTLYLFYDGKPIKADVAFDAPDDWLKHISISFENRSVYPVVAGAFQLDFRELGGDPILFYDVRFGILPDHQLVAPSGRRTPRPTDESPVSVAPGAIGLISFEPAYGGLRSAIESRSSLAEVKSCSISYGFFYFGHDLRWGIGSFTRASPTLPGYTPTAPEDFMPKPQNIRQ